MGLDRRSFLRLAAGTGAAVVAGLALDGCGGGASPELTLIPNDWEFLTGQYRLAVLIASSKVNGAPVQLDAPVTLRVGPERGPLGPPLRTVLHADGPEPAYAMTTYRFDRAGVYNLEAAYKGTRVSEPISVVDPSSSPTPVVGARLIRTPTPTVAAPMGVDPVCTAQPPCPFHQVSLDTALDRHRPIALLFATPALCQSRFCGPVLGNLTDVHGPWAQAVTFIHCEIYNNLQGPTSDADGNTTKPVTAFGLQHEPMLYLAGPDGVIRTRIDNLFDRAEARDALSQAFDPV